ncbi:uncharacterized protein ANIA_11482 [Aspergillus nidulans FGSC A4]|uniref:Uncharacterized protein n=1 Tax=Emericella nidulans (strain FGSC A4 / ATCC 38163 / CBS 112.46 / NRRL 194 / M139) TaxID=227321 RepID=C8VG24_EMENI|nr:hypothetical protein [Aspergillus nidulans FGSC A4]CBF81621.1 TPA: hypothetical protein ANIA_11482 [Aspergillus nidulans FGSC A4]
MARRDYGDWNINPGTSTRLWNMDPDANPGLQTPFPPPVSSGASLIDNLEHRLRDMSNLTWDPRHRPTSAVLFGEQYSSATPNNLKILYSLGRS